MGADEAGERTTCGYVHELLKDKEKPSEPVDRKNATRTLHSCFAGGSAFLSLIYKEVDSTPGLANCLCSYKGLSHPR